MGAFDLELEEAVADAVRAAQERGAISFYDVLESCEGADPKVVARVLQSSAQPAAPGVAVARRETSELSALFPAADPVACQWWYTLDSIERLASRVYEAARPGNRAAFLGAPTVGYQFSRRAPGATVFDVDQHVLDTVSLAPGLTAVRYDVADSVPVEHVGQYHVVLVDPPWYPELVRAFLCRALAMAAPGASVFCSIPPRLTRPGIVQERQDLLRDLLDAGTEIVHVERSATRYLVPEFERAAMSHVKEFDGRPWRSGDLLHVRRKHDEIVMEVVLQRSTVTAFARRPRDFRVFVRSCAATVPASSAWVSRDPRFESTVSRREFDPATLHWWTSEKRGGLLRDTERTLRALHLWAEDKLGCEQTRDALIAEGMAPDSARALCQDLDDRLAIWSTHGSGAVTERPDLSTRTTIGRPYPKKSEDGFRGSFQRDRDRITWSRGLRQLANKTQVFPIATGDYLRNRLSHSLEVVQLATTIGISLGLDLHLIEAGALAHDIGHTPFGHAGEHSLNDLFREVKGSLGFSHYEHGVDIVRWLEDAYQSPSLGGVFGLNLTPEVAECIFKHTYCHAGGPFCQDELYRISKHRGYFKNDRCHVEGQAVRIADKVSYLISDLEDGIRCGALGVAELLSCALLRRPPLDLVLAPGESLHERFLSQRSLLIGILMEDIIVATAKRLAAVKSLQDVRSMATYAVDHSEGLRQEVDEVWTKLQAGRLHVDGRVRIANLRAAKIVRELAVLFAVAPELVEPRFREGHQRLHGSEYLAFYRRETGPKVTLRRETLAFLMRDGVVALGFDVGKDPEVPVEHFVQAKDFVAGLSDERARSLHHDLLAF